MKADGVIAGLNWEQHGIGDECDPMDLLEFLSQAENGQKISFPDSDY